MIPTKYGVTIPGIVAAKLEIAITCSEYLLAMSKILAKIEIEERADIPVAREHRTTARVGWSQVT